MDKLAPHKPTYTVELGTNNQKIENKNKYIWDLNVRGEVTDPKSLGINITF